MQGRDAFSDACDVHAAKYDLCDYFCSTDRESGGFFHSDSFASMGQRCIASSSVHYYVGQHDDPFRDYCRKTHYLPPLLLHHSVRKVGI